MNKFVAPSPPSEGDEGRNVVLPPPVCVPATNFNDPDNYEFCNNVYEGN